MFIYLATQTSSGQAGPKIKTGYERIFQEILRRCGYTSVSTILHTLALNLKKILFKNIGLELCFMIVVSTFFPHQILVMLSPCLWEVYGWFGLLQQSSSCFCGMWSENRELWLRCPLIYFPHCRGHLHCWWTCEKTKKSQNWKKCTCIIIRFRH